MPIFLILPKENQMRKFPAATAATRLSNDFLIGQRTTEISHKSQNDRCSTGSHTQDIVNFLSFGGAVGSKKLFHFQL